MRTSKNQHTEDAQQRARQNPLGITGWELAALMRVSNEYWDKEVLTSMTWEQAREAMAIDSLLGSLENKLSERGAIGEPPTGDWPLANEEELRAMWEESG